MSLHSLTQLPGASAESMASGSVGDWDSVVLAIGLGPAPYGKTKLAIISTFRRLYYDLYPLPTSQVDEPLSTGDFACLISL